MAHHMLQVLGIIWKLVYHVKRSWQVYHVLLFKVKCWGRTFCDVQEERVNFVKGWNTLNKMDVKNLALYMVRDSEPAAEVPVAPGPGPSSMQPAGTAVLNATPQAVPAAAAEKGVGRAEVQVSTRP